MSKLLQALAVAAAVGLVGLAAVSAPQAQNDGSAAHSLGSLTDRSALGADRARGAGGGRLSQDRQYRR